MKSKSFFIVLLGVSMATAIRANADDASATLMVPSTNAVESAPNPPDAAAPANTVEVVTNSMAAATNTPAVTNVVVVSAAAPVSNTVVVATYPADGTNSLIVAPVPAYRHWTAGVEAGTMGAGPDVRWHFSDLVGVGAAYDRMSFSGSGTIEDNEYHAHVRLMTVPVTADFYPMHNDYFHVSAGVLLNWNRFSGSSSGTVNLDGTPYVGTANLVIKQRPVDPYIAVGGNYYFTKSHHLSLGGEFGLAYTGIPRVNLTLNPPSGAVETQRQQEEAKIRHDLHWVQLWPILKLSLNYSF